MGKRRTTASFLSAITAAPAVQQVVKKGLFGKSYVLLGSLYIYLGSWAYQQGGALGYGLKGHPDTLGKFLEVAPDKVSELFATMRETAEADLQQVAGQEKTFLQLYVVRELRAFGIDLFALPKSKALYTRCSTKTGSVVMRMSFARGAGLGYHFPGTFKEYWDESYQFEPNSEWQEARAHGLQLPETPQERPLGTAVVEMLEMALAWAAEEAPGLLSVDDIRILQRVISAG